jgi:hypothetical protein
VIVVKKPLENGAAQASYGAGLPGAGRGVKAFKTDSPMGGRSEMVGAAGAYWARIRRNSGTKPSERLGGCKAARATRNQMIKPSIGPGNQTKC